MKVYMNAKIRSSKGFSLKFTFKRHIIRGELGISFTKLGNEWF
jgi:hypothetical protein